MTEPIGALLMAYGGPDNLDQIPGYLADIPQRQAHDQSRARRDLP